jgi:hypothetical protein
MTPRHPHDDRDGEDLVWDRARLTAEGLSPSAIVYILGGESIVSESVAGERQTMWLRGQEGRP